MLAKVLILALFLVAINAYTVKVINDVACCAGRSYPSIKLFWKNGGQQDYSRGQSRTFNSATDFDPNTGTFGIQENGMYCRIGGNPNTQCWNPDNAGMQVKYNGNCASPQLIDPWYCNPNAPNAKDFVVAKGSGTWPNCVLTLTRKAGARNCDTRC